MRELAPNAAATATPASPMYPMAVIHLAWDSLRARASEYGMRVKATMVYLSGGRGRGRGRRNEGGHG
jgi:hypothetical protein